MRVDGDAIGNAEAQFAYVYLRLESGPAALCLEVLKHANLTKEFDHQRIIDQLDRHNGVENKVQRAKEKLRRLEQTGSFHKFLVSFEVTLGEAGGWNWDDEHKIDALRAGLSDYLKRKLQDRDANGTTPTEYLEFVALCKRYSSSGPQPQSSSAPGPSSSSRQLYDPKSADKMDLSAVRINTIHRSSSGSRHSSRRSSRSSSIDRSYCYRCRATDHYVSVCSVQPSSSSSQPPAASTTPPPPPRPTLASVTAVLKGKKQWGIRVPANSNNESESEEESDSSDESGSSGFIGHRRSGRAC